MVTKVIARCAAYLACAAFVLPVTRANAARFSVEHDDNEVRITTFDGVLAIRPLTDNAIRVRYYVRPVAAESRILLADLPPANFHITQTPDVVTVATPAMSAEVDLSTGLVGFYKADGTLILAEEAGTRKIRASINPSGESSTSISESFVISPEERLYGTGQFQDGEFALNNLPRRLIQVNTQIAIPFVVSTRGYGVLWHNYGLTDFNMPTDKIQFGPAKKTGRFKTVYDWNNGTTSKLNREIYEYVARFKTPTDGQYGVYFETGAEKHSEGTLKIDGNEIRKGTGSAFVQLDSGEHEVKAEASGGVPTVFIRTPKNDFSFASPVADAIDYVVFSGNKPADVIAAYRVATGAAPLLPRWAYGFIQCRERYESQSQLLSSLNGFRSRGIPVDVIVQDWQYWGSHGWNAMRFDSRSYNDPAGMVQRVHDAHAHIMISVWSKIGMNTVLGKSFAASKFFIPGTEWVDFTNPEAAKAYWANVNNTFNSIGFDAWWLDATEPEDEAMVGKQIFAGNSDRYRNLYPELVSKTVYEGQRAASPGKRVFILTRSAFAGQQRYASAVWSGDITADWDTFRRQIPAGLGYVSSGLPYWTTDCGGFFRPKNQYLDTKYHELLIRWMEFATFCPLQRMHGEHSETEPWNYGKATDTEIRRWINLRYRLLPYIYSTAAQVTFSGASIIEPLIMQYPNDERAQKARSEFLFGPAFLVAPVVQAGDTSRNVYLPKQAPGWYDFFTGKYYESGNNTTMDAPLNSIPVLVKAGSIVPLGPLVQYADEKPDAPIELRVYPGADADFVLYEDDGVTYGYEKGECARISLHWNETTQVLSIGERQGNFPGMVEKRTFVVVKVGAGIDPITVGVKTVNYDGHELNVSL
jgi:alpha-D-xyloside xylohydrolase